MPRRHHAALLLPLVMITALGACSAGPSIRPVIAVRGDSGTPTEAAPSGQQPVPDLEDGKDSGLNWQECTDSTLLRLGPTAPQGGSFQCARMSSTLDAPSRPGRGSLSVSVLKAGTGKSPLVVVSDADGEPGTLKAARLASSLPPEVLSRFSLIGVDRRGTGKSDGVTCVPESARLDIVEFDPASTDNTELRGAITTASQECVLDLENRLTAMDSWRAAADLEKLREALGVGRLNAVGVGDGSRVLSLYASRFPNRIGRMVFDGAPDPTLDAIGAAEARAVAAEATFDAFAKDCAVRGCALGANAKQEFTALLDQLRTTPLRVLGIALTPGTASQAVLVGLADRARWPALADAISAAKAGDGNGLVGLVEPLVADVDENPPRLDAALVTGCNDTSTRIPPDRVTVLTTDWREKHPLFGALYAQRLLLCASFPVPSPLKVPALNGAPPILVVSTATDPVTPQQGTERAAGQLPAGVVVGWQGGGHGALGLSQCATTAAKDFLLDAKVPANGTVCPP
ncbi:alpha/beta hydrolase [Umezawaea tangerina]|uniref:TAP-like protein n=1 Tax=Umezawaea tangerina TaxID=84725 RepID=A0A2T0SC28_9PSEU|nr:alpha/beta fold hydrolase [Umezawaea tangerina]PRY30962.1 TAP-like protein [Umezawaea tangerina]